MYDILNGCYEAIVGNVYNDGNMIRIEFIIRNDVPQRERNKVVTFPLFRNPNTGYYPEDILAVIEKALGIPKDEKYNNFNDYALKIIGKCCRITVRNENFKGRSVLKIRKFERTEKPDCKHLPPERQASASNRFKYI